MPSNITNQDEAMALIRMVESGQLSPEDRDEVINALAEYEQEATARDDFMTSVDMEPKQAPAHPNLRAPRTSTGVFGEFTEGGYRELMGTKYETEEEAREAYLKENPFGKAEAAAMAGVDVTSGLPEGIRATAGLLAFNPAAEAAALTELTKRQFEEGEVPPGIPYAANVNGVPVALTRTESGYKYVAVDPVGIDLGDVASFAGELPSLALEIGGSIAGAVGGAAAGGGVASLPGAILGSAAGSAAGAAAAIPLRAQIARMAGVPDEIIDKVSLTDEALEEAVYAAAGDLVGAGFFGAIRKMSNASAGRILEADDVARVWDQTVENTRIADEFAERTGQKVDLTLAQATGDSEIIQAERIVRDKAKTKAAQSLKVTELQQDRVVQESLRDLTQQRVRTPSSEVRSVSEVTEDVTAGVRKGARQARETMESASDDLDAFGREMDDIPSADAFVATRELAAETRDAALNAERKAWDTYRKEAEWSQGQGSNIVMHSPADSPIKKVMLDMDDDAGRALLESTQGATTRFLEDAGLPVREGGATKGLAGEWLDPRELHFTLSDLKRRVRQAERGIDPDGFRVTDMRKLIGAIEETINGSPMRRISTGNPVKPEKAARVREAFSSATDLTRKVHTLFDGVNMKALLNKNPRTGQLDMPAGMIREKLFKPQDSRFLDEALEAVGENPAVKVALGDELVKKHAAAVRNDVTGQAHAKFLDAHADHIRRLGIDPDTLRGPAGLAQAVKNAERTLAGVKDRLSRTFGKRLSDEGTDAVNIHTELMNIPASRVGNTMEFLDRAAPALAREVRDHSLVQIRRELSSKGDTMINFEKLWKYVDEQGGQLAALHGRGYVDDLTAFKRMEKVLQLQSLGKSVPGQNVQSSSVEITRSLFGPLSKKQRFISAVQRNTRRLRGNALKAIIASPEDLGHFVRNRIENLPQYIQQLLVLDALDEGVQLLDRTTETQTAAAQMGAEGTRGAGVTLGSTIAPGRQSPAQATAGLQARPELDRLKRHEGTNKQGDRHVAYADTVGKTTIGYGHNLDDNPLSSSDLAAIGATRDDVKNGLSEEQATKLLELDHKKARLAAQKLPGWSKMNDARRSVITNMVFNMGVTRVRGFKNMLAAIASERWDDAAREMLDSKWATQVGSRAEELAETMREGS